MPGKHNMGSGGYCVCPRCGERIAHRSGIPCQREKCPKCGTNMLREGSEHFELWMKNKKKNENKDSF